MGPRWVQKNAALLLILVGIILLAGMGMVVSATTPSDHLGYGHSSNISTNESGNSSQVCIIYFYSSGCPYCEEVSEYFDQIQRNESVTIHRYRLGVNPEAYQAFVDKYNISGEALGATPVIFVNDSYIYGSVGIKSRVDRLLESNQSLSCPSFVDEYAPGGEPVTLKTVATIVGLAIGDAVNPCALAVLMILLTTILSRNPEKPKQVLFGGFAFAFAVMGTYLIMGLTLIAGIKAAAQISGLDITILRPLFGGAAVILGILNVGDWLFENDIRFVPEVPKSWRPSMQRYLTEPLWKHSSIVKGAALAGIGVSLFLLPCTSGPYFVAGGMLANRAWYFYWPLLILYNFIFILPMIIISIIVYRGTISVERISSWRDANINRLHGVAGIILIVLGGLIVLGIV